MWVRDRHARVHAEGAAGPDGRYFRVPADHKGATDFLGDRGRTVPLGGLRGPGPSFLAAIQGAVVMEGCGSPDDQPTGFVGGSVFRI